MYLKGSTDQGLIISNNVLEYWLFEKQPACNTAFKVQHVYGCVFQVPASRVFCGGKGATKNLQQGGCLVGGSDLLPVPLWTQGTTPKEENE